jgi:hypothetical protein
MQAVVERLRDIGRDGDIVRAALRLPAGCESNFQAHRDACLMAMRQDVAEA